MCAGDEQKEGIQVERSNPVKELADALQDCVEPPGREKRTENLASALQACLNHAVAEGVREVREVEKRVDARLDKQDETLRMMSDHLAKQDDTLRLFWKQLKGNGKLPIDE